MRNAKMITRPGAGRHGPQPAAAGGRAGLAADLPAGRPGGQKGAPHLRPRRHAHLFHGVYGLGSKDFNKYDAAAVVENMLSCYEKKRRFFRDFYVGIEGPLTLRPAPLSGYTEREMGMTFIGVGAEGVKTALESAALIYAQESGTGRKFIQSGARYGAARKGAPVFMNLRISSQPIRNSSELTERDVLAFFNEKFLSDQILKEYVGGLKENGLLVINTTKSWKEIMATFPDQVQSLIKYRHIKIVTLDGTKAAMTHLNRNLPGDRHPGPDQSGNGHPAGAGIRAARSGRSWKKSWGPKRRRCWRPTFLC